MELKELNVPTTIDIEPTQTSHSQKKKAEIARRPEVDVIIVALTWGILLWHVCQFYSPFTEFYLAFPRELDSGPIKEDAYLVISAGYIIQMFMDFVSAWIMPMFFYISGKGEYFIKYQTLYPLYIIVQIKRKIDAILFQLLQASMPTLPCSEEPRPSSEMSEFTASSSQLCLLTW